VRRRYKILISLLAGVLVVGAGWAFLSQANIPVLETSGQVAGKQRDLIIFTVILSLVVVIPVFALLFGIAWRFRAGNTKASYKPDWDGNKLLEAVWWGLPFIIIVILSVVIWISSHELDPYRPLSSDKKPVVVQVVALQWKWLFVYPEQGIATVNQLQFPVDTPVNFTITSDAPMNSFWIPSLGGQVYAMSGMSTKLHLQADKVGSYNGSSANISGKGFAGMKFVARATSQTDFDSWVQGVKKNADKLDKGGYERLAKPTENTPQKAYVLVDDDLYDTIIMKYMGHGKQQAHDENEHEHDSATMDHDMSDMKGMSH
jgi:cytochrome o ubiquinol oxidase subunit II